ncbi:TolC family protein [bacterium]|nr:TolC family protein [bacterium]
MKSKAILIAALLFLLLQSSYAEQQISIDDVTRLALENSLDIQIAKIDVYKERTSLGKAKSIFDTFLNSGASYEDDKKKTSTTLSRIKTATNEYSLGVEKKLPTGSSIKIDAEHSLVDANSSSSAINNYNESSIKFSLNQSLGKNFFGLADRSNIKITKINIDNAEYSSLGEIENALYKAQAAYWNVVLKEKELDIKLDMQKEAEKLYSIYKENYERGTTEKGDLFAIEANMRTRKNEVLIAHLEKEIAKNNLLFLLNEEDTHIQLQPLDPLVTTLHSVDVYAILKEAILHRRDYKVIKNKIESQNIDIKIKKDALWPEIDLEASFLKNGLASNYQDSWNKTSDENNYEFFTGITFRIPLENRSAKADLEKAKLNKEQLLLFLKRTERLILKEINNKVKEVNSLKNRIELLTSISKLQENKLKEEMKHLSYGRSSSDIILRYEEDLLQANLDLSSSLFKYRVSLIDLDLAKNTLLDKYWKGVL